MPRIGCAGEGIEDQKSVSVAGEDHFVRALLVGNVRHRRRPLRPPRRSPLYLGASGRRTCIVRTPWQPPSRAGMGWSSGERALPETRRGRRSRAKGPRQ